MRASRARPAYWAAIWCYRCVLALAVGILVVEFAAPSARSALIPVFAVLAVVLALGARGLLTSSGVRYERFYPGNRSQQARRMILRDTLDPRGVSPRHHP